MRVPPLPHKIPRLLPATTSQLLTLHFGAPGPQRTLPPASYIPRPDEASGHCRTGSKLPVPSGPPPRWPVTPGESSPVWTPTRATTGPMRVRRQNKWDKRGAFKACNLDANRLRQFSDLPTSVQLDSFASPPVSSPVWRLAVHGTYPPA